MRQGAQFTALAQLQAHNSILMHDRLFLVAGAQKQKQPETLIFGKSLLPSLIL